MKLTTLQQYDLVESYARRELYGTPSNITPYSNGTWVIEYGYEDSYTVRIVDGNVVLVD